ncbi:MAG: heavy metal-associated domain-containing protein [Eubacteriales bacterium]|nr:heavy metal-associated domain-containing protein [Eubacteriales bacterium]
MSGEISTAIIVAGLVVICVLSVKSYMKKLRNGCCGGGDGPEKKVKVADKNKEHYSYTVQAVIDGMVCGNCATRVENAFNRMDGVWARVDLGQKQATIRSKEPLKEEDIKDVVRQAGYTVMKIS